MLDTEVKSKAKITFVSQDQYCGLHATMLILFLICVKSVIELRGLFLFKIWAFCLNCFH